MNAVSAQTTSEALTAIVGRQACLTAAEDTSRFATDYRRLYHGKAVAVVLPSTTEEVSRVMAWCYQHDVPVVPQGGNTSLMGGAVPDDTGKAVIISLSRMNKVLAADTINDTLTLQAGVTLSAARSAAEAAGRLFPLRIGSEGSCQIGGNLATNAGGTAVLRYGNMRDLVLGIEVVLPDGRVMSALRGLRKDNTGFDLKQLFVGSEGTLGIIKTSRPRTISERTTRRFPPSSMASPMRKAARSPPSTGSAWPNAMTWRTTNRASNSN